jgi:hypothetical protein
MQVNADHRPHPAVCRIYRLTTSLLNLADTSHSRSAPRPILARGAIKEGGDTVHRRRPAMWNSSPRQLRFCDRNQPHLADRYPPFASARLAVSARHRGRGAGPHPGLCGYGPGPAAKAPRCPTSSVSRHWALPRMPPGKRSAAPIKTWYAYLIRDVVLSLRTQTRLLAPPCDSRLLIRHLPCLAIRASSADQEVTTQLVPLSTT